ncbi:MAG: hypothetical protein E6J13_10980 [Chloroflexi bacterium]|nr:MAG: hypothetical protein E6J13_10980 [Chloroflexota bacterium]
MRRAPISAVVFAILGALLLVAAVVLAWLGSFASIAIASVGMFFIAGALVAQAAPSSTSRALAVLAVAAGALIVFGLTATPFFYLGWGLLAGAAALAVVTRLAGSRSVTPRER